MPISSPNRSIKCLETVLIVGPTPPPAHGISVLTEVLLQSGLKQSFDVVHLDTADRRTLANVARLELHNVGLALYHGARFQWLLLRKRPALVYMPVSESRLGFVRTAFSFCRVGYEESLWYFIFTEAISTPFTRSAVLCFSG